MSAQRQVNKTNGAGGTAISRRNMLAAGGIVVFGGLSGCLSRVASAATNTGASPAAVFAGKSSDDDVTTLGEPRVSRLAPTIAAGSGSLSGEVELEGWVTSLSVMAQNHNSSRSNRSSGIQAPDGDDDSDGDGVGDGTEGSRANYNNTRSNRSTIARPPDILEDELEEDDETFRVVSRLDTELLEATETAWRSISKRSARTGRNPELDREVSAALESMAATLSMMREELVKCPDGVCKVALENVEDREEDVERALRNVETGEWEAFGNPDGDEALFAGDYLLPAPAFDPSGRFSPAERAGMYRYFDGKVMAGERFTVCLPDAELPGGNGNIREAVTPQRFIDYITGGEDGDEYGDILIDGVPLVFDFGAAPDADGGSPCAVTDDGQVVCWSPHLSAAISEPTSTGGSLEVIRGDEMTVLVSDKGTPTPPGLEKVCERIGADGSCGEGVWTRPSLPSSGSGVSVFQVMVQPPECPHPFPALLYVQQCRNDDQLIYTGGWIIDDAALYERATTVLTMTGPTEVVGIDPDHLDSDSDGDGILETIERASRRRRSRGFVRYNARGARIDSGSVESLIEAGVLSRGTVDGDEYGFVTNIDVTTPILHLTNAGSASNEVKFKAGAELSGQVN